MIFCRHRIGFGSTNQPKPNTTVIRHCYVAILRSSDIYPERVNVLQFEGSVLIAQKIVLRNHDVDAAELLYGGVKEVLEFRNLANIGLHADGNLTQITKLLFQRFGRLGMGNVVDDDFSSLTGQGQRSICGRID